MNIDAIHVHHVAMPLVYPFRTAFGNETVIDSILLEMRSGPLSGWGEASPWARPAYSPEFAAGAFLAITSVMAPLLLGADINAPTQLQERLAPIRGNFFAKAALDLAWWDLHAQAAGRPLWQVLGGRSPDLTVGADLGVMESLDALLSAAAEAQERGFQRLKLKIRPGWELDIVREVRRSFPDLPTHVDCNSAYSLHDTPLFEQLDTLGLAMIEQPLAHDDLLDHATLQRRIHTPICLDESITSPARARQAIEIEACRWINIKPGRVGGLTHAVAIHDLCSRANIPCWVGGMLESSVGAHHCIALATLPNFQYPADIFPSKRFYAADLGTPAVTLTAPSQVSAPTTPGCGARPDPDRLAALTVRSWGDGDRPFERRAAHATCTNSQA